MMGYSDPFAFLLYAGVIATLLVFFVVVIRLGAFREQPESVGFQFLGVLGQGFALAAALALVLVVAALGGETLRRWMPKLLVLAGLGHFLILAASFQVPTRLGWSEELARLRPLNRKLMWTYGGFTVLTIVAFGALTLFLRGEMLRGDKAAVALAAFIGVYWAARIGVDVFYFKHSDWPKGPGLVLGHALLMMLFSFLALTYLGVVAWQLSGGGR
ncbi:MAG: hypothetical protein K8T20_12565 [Planctomycetes bacterium]|nr:hypothetical protein [Planctomycetota bacterium]